MFCVFRHKSQLVAAICGVLRLNVRGCGNTLFVPRFRFVCEPEALRYICNERI